MMLITQVLQKIITGTKGQKLIKYFKDHFEFTFIYKILIEQAIFFYVIIFIQLYNVNFDTTDHTVSNIFTLFISFFMFPIPFYTFFILYKNRNKLDNKEFKRKHGALYEDMRPRGIGPAIFTAMFFIRRFLFAVIALTMIENPTVQILLFSWVCLLYFIISLWQ